LTTNTPKNVASRVPSEIRECPYIGLRPFERRQAEFFFGRETERKVLLANVARRSVTVMFGPSGVGKSSLLWAGLVPDLAAQKRTKVLFFNQWQVPQDEIGIGSSPALRAMAKKVAPQTEISNLAQAFLHRLRKDSDDVQSRSLLVVLDQFDEYFTYHPTAGAGADEELGSALQIITDEDINARLLISIRDDTLSYLDRFTPYVPRLLENSIRLDHLNAVGARNAIALPPAKRRELGVTFGPGRVDPELVERLLEDPFLRTDSTRGDDGIAEPRYDAANLQRVLMHLWEDDRQERGGRFLSTLRSSRGQPDTLSAATFAKYKRGAGDIAAQQIKQLAATLNWPFQQWLAVRLFTYLAPPSGQKIAYSAIDLARFTRTRLKRVAALLSKLEAGQHRILRRVTLVSGGKSRSVYELYHDRLAAPLLEWRNRKRLHRRLGYVGGGVLILIAAAVAWQRFADARLEERKKAVAIQESNARLLQQQAEILQNQAREAQQQVQARVNRTRALEIILEMDNDKVQQQAKDLISEGRDVRREFLVQLTEIPTPLVRLGNNAAGLLAASASLDPDLRKEVRQQMESRLQATPTNPSVVAVLPQWRKAFGEIFNSSAVTAAQTSLTQQLREEVERLYPTKSSRDVKSEQKTDSAKSGVSDSALGIGRIDRNLSALLKLENDLAESTAREIGNILFPHAETALLFRKAVSSFPQPVLAPPILAEVSVQAAKALSLSNSGSHRSELLEIVKTTATRLPSQELAKETIQLLAGEFERLHSDSSGRGDDLPEERLLAVFSRLGSKPTQPAVSQLASQVLVTAMEKATDPTLQLSVARTLAGYENRLDDNIAARIESVLRSRLSAPIASYSTVSPPVILARIGTQLSDSVAAEVQAILFQKFLEIDSQKTSFASALAGFGERLNPEFRRELQRWLEQSLDVLHQRGDTLGFLRLHSLTPVMNDKELAALSEWWVDAEMEDVTDFRAELDASVRKAFDVQLIRVLRDSDPSLFTKRLTSALEQASDLSPQLAKIAEDKLNVDASTTSGSDRRRAEDLLLKFGPWLSHSIAKKIEPSLLDRLHSMAETDETRLVFSAKVALMAQHLSPSVKDELKRVLLVAFPKSKTYHSEALLSLKALGDVTTDAEIVNLLRRYDWLPRAGSIIVGWLGERWGTNFHDDVWAAAAEGKRRGLDPAVPAQ
jgi:hypothetical protein